MDERLFANSDELFAKADERLFAKEKYDPRHGPDTMYGGPGSTTFPLYQVMGFAMGGMGSGGMYGGSQTTIVNESRTGTAPMGGSGHGFGMPTGPAMGGVGGPVMVLGGGGGGTTLAGGYTGSFRPFGGTVTVIPLGPTAGDPIETGVSPDRISGARPELQGREQQRSIAVGHDSSGRPAYWTHYTSSRRGFDAPGRPELQQPSAPERDFYSRGGRALGESLLAIGVGVLILSNPVGWAAGVAGALSIAGGVAGGLASGVQLGASYAGFTTRESDELTNTAISAMLSQSSMGGMLGGGLLPPLSGSQVSYERGMALGSLAEFGFGLPRSLSALLSRMERGPFSTWPVVEGMATNSPKSLIKPGPPSVGINVSTSTATNNPAIANPLMPSSKAVRPTWRESENLANSGTAVRSQPQVSFKEGVVVKYSAKGSTRPDSYLTDYNVSVEVKNPNLSKGNDKLISKVVNQAQRRAAELPPGAKQALVIDVRGQNIPEQQLQALFQEINMRSGNLFGDRWWVFMD